MMGISSRRTKSIAILSAAAGLALSVRSSSAQTWINPNTGNWSVAANWVDGVVPASSATTALTFNATGTQTYTATNDIANPFALNVMTLNNAGTGAINIAGQALNFIGTNPTINNNGSGPASIANNLQSTTAGVPLTFAGTGAGTTSLSGGGTLYSLNMNSGAVNLTGGTLVLTSTNRRKDNVPNPPIDDGFWSFNIGDVAGQTARFTQSGGVLDAQHGMIAVQPGTIGYATFTGASSVATFSNAVQARFGINAGAGTWTVASGAQVTGTFFEVGRQMNATANVFVNGGSLTALTQVLVARSAGGNGSLTITNGGVVSNGTNSFMSPTTGTNGTVSISGAGSRFANNGGVFIASGGSLVNGGVSRITVNNGGQFTSQSFTFVQDDGGNSTVNVDGPGSAISSAGIGAGTGSWASAVGATSIMNMNVTNGALASVPGGALFMGGGIVSGTGDPIPSGTVTINVTGAGANTSTLNAGFLQMGQALQSNATLNVNTLSTVNVGTNLIVGRDPDARATLNVSGANATVNAPGFVVPFPGTGALGDPIPGGNGTVTVGAGGRINTNVYGVSMANNPDQNGFVSISGAGAAIVGTATAELVVGGSGNATLGISNGGRFDSTGAALSANAFFGADLGGTSVTTVNAGTLAVGGQFQVGGNGGDDGSPASVTATNGGLVQANQLAVIYTPGTLTIGTGTSAGRYVGGGDMAVDGNVFYNAGTFNAAGTLGVGGNVILSSANRNAAGTPSNKKLLEVGQATLTTSGVIDLNDNDMLIHENNRQKYVNFVKAARNNGLWNQPGITSTAAKNSVPKNKGLGVLSGAEYIAVNGTPFDGKTVVATDTVIKFTYNGDTDFNGVINFDDYARTDSGFNNGRSGWLNGDFDYNGVVNFDDYSLIDQAFNTQGSTVLAAAGDPAGPGFDRTIVATSKFGAAAMTVDGVAVAVAPMDRAVAMDGATGNGGNLNSVPEPTALSAIGLGLIGVGRRRRRRHV